MMITPGLSRTLEADLLVNNRRTLSKKPSRLSAIDKTTGFRRYYPNRATTLYYIRFKYNNSYYYKVGITTRSIKQRFTRDHLDFKVLFSKTYPGGRLAYVKEQEILRKYYMYRYSGPPILHSGNTEIFTKNVMRSD